MKKCLKITLVSTVLDSGMREFIRVTARKLDLEGTVQLVEPNEIIIIACGSKENIDGFLDGIHQGVGVAMPEDIHVEPFLKEKDYRGVFRILE